MFTPQIREKTQYAHPWRQTPRSRVTPDTEVKQLMTPSKTGIGARPKAPRRDILSPGLCASFT